MAEASVSEDRRKRAALELSVQRHDEGEVMIRVLEAYVAAALAD